MCVPILDSGRFTAWKETPIAWTVSENLAPTAFRSPDPSTRSQLLYRQRCPDLPSSLDRARVHSMDHV